MCTVTMIGGCQILAGIEERTLADDLPDSMIAPNDGSSSDAQPDSSIPSVGGNRASGGASSTDASIDSAEVGAGGTGPATGGTASDGGNAGSVSTGGMGGTGGTSGVGGTGGTGVSSCTATDVKASVATGSEGPTLIYAGSLWSLAWRVGSAIHYNAVTSDGGLQLQNDAILVTALAGVSYGEPELGSLGDEAVVAYGEKQGTSAYLSLRRFLPASGATTVGPVQRATDSDVFAPHVGAVAATENEIVISSRTGNDVATKSRVSRFTTVPVFATSVDATSNAYTTAIAWSPNDQKFGFVAIADSTGSGGKLITYGSDLGEPSVFAFTQTSDSPATASYYTVSIAAGPTGFAIAWVDQQDFTDQVYVALVSMSGQSIAHTKASDTTDRTKRYPKIVFDGMNFGVGWLEEISSGQHQLMWRRFSDSLEPRGASQRLQKTPQFARFGLASAGVDEFGIAYVGLDGSKYLTRIVCKTQ